MKRLTLPTMPRTTAIQRTWAGMLTALLLSGCATLSESECRVADWQAIGIEDGRAGHTPERVERHREACAEYGIRPDLDRYLSGRAEGLRGYCRLENAFHLGRNGQPYRGVCPAPVDGAFRRYHAAAYDAYRLSQDMDSLERRIDHLERELRDPKLSDKARQRLRQDIRDEDRRRERLRGQLQNQEREVSRLMREAQRTPHWH